MNRRLRTLAKKRFGSFDNLVDLMRYNWCKNQENIVVAPINNDVFIVRKCPPNKPSYFSKYSRWSRKEVERTFRKRIKRKGLEYEAKIYMLLLSTCVDSNGIFNPKKKFNNEVSMLSYFVNGRKYFKVESIDCFKSYDDILKVTGMYKKEKLFGK
jgi:hypothetical protein